MKWEWIVIAFCLGVLMPRANQKVKFSELDPYKQMEIKTKVLPAIRENFPSMFLGLNTAQYRALRDSYTPMPGSGLLPTFHAVSFANGVGKTHMMGEDMIGWTMGPEFLRADAFPIEAIEFYRSLGPLRDAGSLSLRLVCMSDDMKPGGSVFVILHDIFPWAKLSGQDNGKCFRQIEVPHPFIDGVSNYIQVKTFDQDEVKHSGNTCHRIWINEILPGKLLGETIGRTRSKAGQLDGSILNTATMLDQAGYLEDLEDDPDIRYRNSAGHLYENCAGHEVTEEMAREVEEAIGVRLQKNPDGPGYITNGVLSKSSITSQIAFWRKNCPDQLEARKSGKFIRGAGRIYVTYNPEVHEVDDEMYDPVPPYPAIQIVDPHSAKPDFSIWAIVTPGDRLVVIGEWPTVEEFGPYERLDFRKHTIGETCEEWRRMESMLGISGNVVARLGDPNRFNDPNPRRTGGRLWMDYAEHGFNFFFKIDDDLDTGIRAVQEYLHYDMFRRNLSPNDPLALPHLFFARRCENTRRGISRYGFRTKRDPDAATSEQINKKFSEPADVVRYMCVWHKQNCFAQLRTRRQSGSDDYEKIKQGRVPKKRRMASMDFNAKGRRVLAPWGN